MADEGAEEDRREEDDEEEWTEPAEVPTFDGYTTTLVGGFSAVATINDGIALLKSSKDRILVLKGVYEGDVTLDSTVSKGVMVQGDEMAAPNEIKLKGQLIVTWSEPKKGAQTAEEPEPEPEPEPAVAEEGENADGEVDPDAPPKPKKKEIFPKLLTVQNLWFQGGAEFQVKTDAQIQKCIFGTPLGKPQLTRAVKAHAMSTVCVKSCKVYGSDKSAIYCFPFSRVRFEACDCIGSEKPKEQGPAVRHKKGYVPPPPPPPCAPSHCECEVGIHLDNSHSTFKECTLCRFNIGIVASDACQGAEFDKCAISLVSTVGALLEKGNRCVIRRSTVKLCGRECVVVGSEAHPTLRGNTLVGDVRLKKGCAATGISDNIVALNGQVRDESGVFSIKGFQVVEKDPTVPKPKKIKPAEE